MKGLEKAEPERYVKKRMQSTVLSGAFIAEEMVGPGGCSRVFRGVLGLEVRVQES